MKSKKVDYDLSALETTEITRKLKDGRLGYSALQMKQGDRKMYTVVASPREIFPCLAVPHCDGKTGYQRHLSEKRARDIAAYFDGGMPIPGNIIIAVRPAADFVYDSKSKRVSFKPVPGSLAVIDGQHRSWGSSLAETDVQMTFTFMVNISAEVEAGLFLDVNGKQKGVPSTLVSRVKGVAGRENATEELISDLFQMFEDDEKSALSGKLSALEAKPGFISHRGFMLGMKPVMRLGLIKKLHPAKRYELMNRLFTHARAVLTDDEFFRALVFGGFLANVERITTIAMSTHQNLKDDAIQAALAPLKWNPETETGFNRAHAQTGSRLNKADVTQHIADLLGDTSTFDADDI